MNTRSHNPALDAALATVPKDFRSRITNSYLEVKRNCVETRYEAAGLAAGKFCESMLRFLQQRITGTSIPFNSKIGNFADECRKLVSASSGSASESERVLLPRALVFLYTMRNRRGIGHVGGDVNPNLIDATVMARIADWAICELIRIHHRLSLEEAQNIVDSISVRVLPDIWEVGGKKRVLREGVKARDQILLLLYSSTEASVLLEDLSDWVEYSNASVFKRSIVRTLHKERLVEYDEESQAVTLSPKGTRYVEGNLLGTKES